MIMMAMKGEGRRNLQLGIQKHIMPPFINTFQRCGGSPFLTPRMMPFWRRLIIDGEPIWVLVERPDRAPRGTSTSERRIPPTLARFAISVGEMGPQTEPVPASYPYRSPTLHAVSLERLLLMSRNASGPAPLLESVIISEKFSSRFSC